MTPSQMAALHSLCFATPRPWTEAEFNTLSQGRGTFFIHQSQSLLVGRVIADEAELLTLAVHPDLRRTGIGHALVLGFLKQAATQGATNAFLEVNADNQAALALYTNVGFARAGVRKGYYKTVNGPAIDALILTTSLTK